MTSLRPLLCTSAISFLMAVSVSAESQERGEPPVAPARLSDEDHQILQPLAQEPGQVDFEGHGEVFYVPSNPQTVIWGYLPNRTTEPVLSVPGESVIVFDTLSHEGILDDQGRDPLGYFTQYGVEEGQVLQDAVEIAASMPHEYFEAGPHVVTGPIYIEGAEPGDVLMVETLEITPRVPYGVISNRHYRGALPGEFPETEEPDPAASAEQPELFRNVSIFTPTRDHDHNAHGVLHNRSMEEVAFPAKPFMGIMGIAPDTDELVHSVPPDAHGGNLDIADLGAGSTLYLPIQVSGALFYTGDPHGAQGNGEVALTALEQSMRVVFRLKLLKNGDPRIPSTETLTVPFGETDAHWLPIGLDEDLNEAMREATRNSIAFLSEKLNMDRATALAYLSAATDFSVSQVVDRTKGIHALIRKEDFANTSAFAEFMRAHEEASHASEHEAAEETAE